MQNRLRQVEKRGASGGRTAMPSIFRDHMDAPIDEDDEGEFSDSGHIASRGGGAQPHVRQNNLLSPDEMDEYLLRGQDEEISNIVGNDRSGQTTAMDFLREHGDSLAVRSGLSGADATHNRRGVGNKAIAINQGPPAALKGKVLFGPVQKLSGWGFSLHARFLKLNKKGLGYFSKAPTQSMANMNLTTPEAIEMLKDEYQPKEVIPLEAIVEVAPLNEQDRNKNKKFFKNQDKKGFKISYESGKTSKKKDLLAESDQQSMANLNLNELQEEKKSDIENGADSAPSSSKIKTWFFALPDEEETKEGTNSGKSQIPTPSLKDWVSLFVCCTTSNHF